MTVCVDAERHDCALDGHCAVKPHWGVVNAAIRGALAGVSLAQLADPQPFVPRAAEGRDYPTPVPPLRGMNPMIVSA